jgi:ribose transport system ATP-binding protein
VRQLSDGRQLQDLFDIQPGEIVGVAGLLGAGRDVLVDYFTACAGARSGTIQLDGQPKRLRTPYQAIRAGMALVPRDRRHQGLILPSPPPTILISPRCRRPPPSAGSGGRALEKARSWIEQLAIRPGRPALPVRFMSGGNQQKAILARWLGTDARLFILDEPTSGSISAPAAIFISAPASWRIADGRCWSPPATRRSCWAFATASW